MALDVCLIHLPTLLAPRSVAYFGTVLPLGLAYVAAAAREAGHRVAVVDAPGAAPDQIIPFDTAVGRLALRGLRVADIAARVPAGTRVIGIGHMFLHEWPLLNELASVLRLRFPDATLVLGGENATGMWEVVLEQCPAIDVCVLGEGEETFADLLDALEVGRPLSDVPGLAWRSPQGVARTPPRARIRDIDALPWPAWDLFPVASYLDRGYGSGVARGRSMPLLTSRGCPYRCTFCSSPAMWTTRYAARDPERIADEVASYQARYGLENADFNDLTAVLTKEWILSFCGVIQRRGLRFTWQLPSGTRSEAVDYEAARALYASGCRNFGYAPESGAETTLRRIKKKVHLPALRASVDDALRAGLRLHGNFILGFPGESLGEMLQTGRLLVDMALRGMHSASVMTFAPYPGCAEYATLRAAGELPFDEPYIYSSMLRSGGRTRSHTRALGSRQLVALQLLFLLGFFGVQYARRPLRAVETARNLLGRRQDSALDKFLATKAAQLFAGG